MNKEQAQSSLNVINKLHNQDLIEGFAELNDFHPECIYAQYRVEKRSNDYIPSIYIYTMSNKPLSVMIPQGAYKYIRLWSSIRAARDFMAGLGWD